MNKYNELGRFCLQQVNAELRAELRQAQINAAIQKRLEKQNRKNAHVLEKKGVL